MIAPNNEPFSADENPFGGRPDPRVPTPPPGIYEGVDFEEYVQWDAVSNSSLFFAAKSMMHYRFRKPVETTPAMRLGKLFHAGRLEPTRIPLLYVVMPDFGSQVRKSDGSVPDKPKATKQYKDLVAEFERVNETREVVEHHEYSKMLMMVGAVSAHRTSMSFLDAGRCEISIVWRDEDSGVLCKGRIDCWQEHRNRVVDLKSTGDASDYKRIIGSRAYHRQLAMYCDGLETLTGVEQRGALIFVESIEPWGVIAAPLSENCIESGRSDYKRFLRQIAECQESGFWPGYESPAEFDIPAYMNHEEPCDLVIGGETIRL